MKTRRNIAMIMAAVTLASSACVSLPVMAAETATESGEAAGELTATFHLNDGSDDDVYETQSFEANKWVTQPEDPTSDAGQFAGWYTDADGTEAFNFNARVTENVDIYAKWETCYTIEAEYTYLDGKPGRGYSGESSGLNMIVADNTENKTASNGYYVGWLYYNNASVDFELEADEAIDDATLVFRLSAEYDPLELTDDELLVEIADEDDNVTDYNFPLTISDVYDLTEENEHGKKDFQNYTAVTGASLSKGYNMISLVVNNNIKGSGGTMYASAPIVDCLYIYTNGTLTPIEYTDNIQ